MSTSVEGLTAVVRGRVVERGDADYDEARALYNAMIDKRPAAIAYCVDEADVSAAVRFANERGLRIAVRGGGHNGGGLGSVDDGLVVDLSAMDEVTVEPASRLARVQGGTLLQKLVEATHQHGLTVPVGIIGTTGAGGLTLLSGTGKPGKGPVTDRQDEKVCGSWAIWTASSYPVTIITPWWGSRVTGQRARRASK